MRCLLPETRAFQTSVFAPSWWRMAPGVSRCAYSPPTRQQGCSPPTWQQGCSPPTWQQGCSSRLEGKLIASNAFLRAQTSRWHMHMSVCLKPQLHIP